jgi:hypothetical protein
MFVGLFWSPMNAWSVGVTWCYHRMFIGEATSPMNLIYIRRLTDEFNIFFGLNQRFFHSFL